MSILDRISAHGGEVIRDGYQITLRRGRLSAGAVKWVQENKVDLMREVWPDYDEWDHQAAIREHLGGLSKEDAEAAAYEDIQSRSAALC